MEGIITEFVLHVQKDEHTAGKPNGKAQDIDSGIKFLTQKIPKSDFEIVFEHISMIYSVG